MSKNKRRSGGPQPQPGERLRELGKGLRQWLASPQGQAARETGKGLRKWQASPQGRALRETAGRLRDHVQPRDQTSEQREASPRRRKKGGGRKPSLAPEEIGCLQEAYRAALKNDATLKKHEAALSFLRELLPRPKLKIGDSVLLRHVIRPVLSK